MIVLKGGQVLTAGLDGVEPLDILIDGDAIADVGHALAPDGAQTIDATGLIILPGLINAHTHANNNLTRGSGDNWTLEDLRNYGSSVYANRTPEDDYLSAAIGAIEMLKTGCTAAYDQFSAAPAITTESVEAVVRAYAESGIRAVLAPSAADGVFYEAVPGLMDILPSDLRKRVAAIGSAPADSLLRLFEESIRRWDHAADDRIRIAIAPSIPGECSDEFLRGCAAIAREYGASLHTHLAETKVQAVSAVKRWGTSIVRHLADINVLGPHFVAGHGVWIDDDDMGLLADAGATVAHNPASNLKLGSGIAPVREMLDQGLTVGLGADGSMASDNQNMFEAMRIAGLINKVRAPHNPERWLGAVDIWRMATIGGARVLGLGERIGEIAPGRRADLVLLKRNSTFLMPSANPLNTLVYAETGSAVKLVIVGGRVVVEHGQVLTLDEDTIRAQAQQSVERLVARNQPLKLFAKEIEPFLRQVCRACVAMPFPINRYAAEMTAT
jgi:cytosine/adenosine deaminase-related metal-dependent hydrolase